MNRLVKNPLRRGLRARNAVLTAICGALAVAASGCGDEGGDTTASVPCEPAADERGRPFACIAGALVADDGSPVAGVRVAACTEMTCIVANSATNGEYIVQRLPVEPHKVEILGGNKGFMTVAFFQDVLPGELARAKRPVLIPKLTEQAELWLAKSGGTVTVAGGKLVLTAKANVLRYPIGTPEEEMLVEAVEIPVAKLLPYDSEPWKGKESKSLAFVVNPFPLTATESIGLTVTGVGASPNSLYRLYAAHSTTGELDEVGVLAADANGNLVLQPGASLTHLTTLVVVPN